MGDQHVGHARVVLLALHEASSGPGASNLVHGRGQQVLQDWVALSQGVQQRLGALDGAGGVDPPLSAVGPPRLGVLLEVAEALPQSELALRDAGVAGQLWRWRRWVGIRNVREAARGPAPLLQHPPHEEAAGALLLNGAVDRVDGRVEAVVGEPRQRNARLGVLCGKSKHLERQTPLSHTSHRTGEVCKAGQEFWSVGLN